MPADPRPTSQVVPVGEGDGSMGDIPQNAQARAVAAPKAGTRLSGSRLKEAALGLALAVGIFADADYGRDYWTTGRSLVETDDAYVDVHSAMNSPKISGYVSDVPVNDNQH